MTCVGCDRDVTLMDGHYCGHCTSTISSAVKQSLDKLDPLLECPSIYDVFVDEDGLLNIRVETDDSHKERVRELAEEHSETLDALAE